MDYTSNTTADWNAVRRAKRSVVQFLRSRGFRADHFPSQSDYADAAKEVGVALEARKWWNTRLEDEGPMPPVDPEEQTSRRPQSEFVATLDAALWSIRTVGPVVSPQVAAALKRAVERGLAVSVLVTKEPKDCSMLRYLRRDGISVKSLKFAHQNRVRHLVAMV